MAHHRKVKATTISLISKSLWWECVWWKLHDFSHCQMYGNCYWLVLEIKTYMTPGFIYTEKDANTWWVLFSFRQVISNLVLGRRDSERSLTGWMALDLFWICDKNIFLQTDFIEWNGNFCTQQKSYLSLNRVRMLLKDYVQSLYFCHQMSFLRF